MRDPFQPPDETAFDLAFRDDLTGLANRRLLTGLLTEGWDRLVVEHDRVSLLMIDLDRFKEVNDTFGHRRGDDVLRATGDILRRHFRADDVLVRYGGDEFVVVLPGVGADDAVHLGERAREAMAGLKAAVGDGPGLGVGVSFSIGVASFPDDGPTGEEVLEHADRRLFEDKRRRHGVSRTRPGLWRRALAIAGLVVAAGLIAAIATVVSRLPRGRPAGGLPPTIGAGDGRATAAQREAVLRAEVAELRRQLATLREAPAPPAPAAAPEDRQKVGALETRIEELERELKGQGAPAAPAPTPPAIAVAVGEPVAPAVPTTEPTPAPPAARTRPAEPVAVAPVLRGFDEPVYPEAARRLGREAAVELRVSVDETGRVVRVEPAGPRAGLGFDEAARRAAFSARFAPATRGGQVVSSDTTLTIAFRLGRH